jgi:hypothetical protein
MKSLLSVRSVLIPFSMAVVIGALPAAQSGSKAASAPAKKAAAVPAASTSKPAPLSSVAEATHLKLEVTGLTKENAEKIRTALGAAQTTDYLCTHCNMHEAEAGKCPKCSAPLQSEKEALFSSVTPMADSNTLAITLPVKHATRLSDIRTALQANAMTLNAYHLAGRPEILVGGGTATNASALETALQTAKLFESAHVRWDAGAGQLVIDGQAGATPPTEARIREILQPMKLRIDDVVWGRPAIRG